MKFSELAIQGVFLVEPNLQTDERGFFARTVCSDEFSHHGLPTHYCQSSISFNTKLGTLRGMHYQVAPSQEQKLVRCTQGALYDVVIDVRKKSPTFKKWLSVNLSAANRLALAIPPGCAHGFLTLSDNTEVLYLMSEPYHADLATGIRWNDPTFAVSWPLVPRIMSERDTTYPDFAD